MTPLRKKQAAGAAAAALLLLGSAYAWRNANQHKTNELRDNLNGNNDVTLVENFIPITDWLEGQEINKDISVKNNTSVETGNNAYVRISLKEFLEFTNKQEDLSTVRYAVTTAGDFAKFETQADAQTYADANNLTGAPVQVATTAFEGDDYWFIPTNAEATHGQYGKFLVLKVGDGTSKSIIDEAVKNASADASSKHQAITHGEDFYTTQTFGATGTDINAKRAYDSGKLVTDYPTGGGIQAGKDLKDYITWNFGSDVTTLDVFDSESETAQWVIDTETGWVYWSQALAPGQITSNFLDSLKLDNAPKDVSLYYAIHTNLEAVDYNEIDTMAPPQGIEDAWKKKQRFTVTFNTNGGSEVTGFKVAADELITEPGAPTKAGLKFAGWYAKEDLTGKAWNFATDKMPAKNLTLYAKWEEEAVARVYFKDYTGEQEILPAHKITASAPDLDIPDAPKENYYFLGWAEAPNAAKTTTLYVPGSGYTDIRLALDTRDTTYLDYKVKPDHEIKNITTDKTLYAVYYKQRKAVTEVGHEFIWGKSIWRALDTDMNDKSEDGLQALVMKVNVSDINKFVNSGNYYFESDNSNGYDNSFIRVLIDDWYNRTIKGTADESAVQAVSLNNPDFNAFKNNITFTSGSARTNWQWDNYYQDTRFATTLDASGSQQAFVLSFGDIHGYMEVPAATTSVSLLNNMGGWLRSPGNRYNTVGYVDNAGNINQSMNVASVCPIRPALSLLIK